MLKCLIFSVLACVLFYNAAAHAQENTPSEAAMTYAKEVSSACIGQWDQPACHAVMAQSNQSMAANYAEALHKNGKAQAVETIKQHCAASTAPAQNEYPAYAVNSAFTECANIIVDTANSTGIAPDASHYQLLVGSVLCMNEDPRCAAIEQGLSRFD